MKQVDRVNEIIESGIAPISVAHRTIRFFKGDGTILRTSLVLNSLEVGVLGFEQYRYVAGRGKRGESLVACHAEKLFSSCPKDLVSDRLSCITLPAFPKTLLSGRLVSILFENFERYPHVSPSNIAVEISADILYEDKDEVAARLKELRALGVKLAVFEAGDEFCPLFRLAELSADLIFADRFATRGLLADDETASAFPDFVHRHGARVFAPDLPDRDSVERAKKAGYDGYGTEFEMEEDMSDE